MPFGPTQGSGVAGGAASGAMTGAALGPWGALAGGLIGAAGSFLGAQGSNQANQAAFDYDVNNRTQSMQRGLSTLFGYQGMMDSALSGGSQQSSDAFNARIGGPIFDQMKQFSQQGLGDLQGILGQFDRESKSINRGSGDAEAAAKDYGLGRSEVIREDAKRAERDANQRGKAQAAQFGASSLGMNMEGANKERFTRSTNDALTSLNMGMIDRLIAAIGQRQNLQNNRSTTRAGLATNVAQSSDALRRSPMNLVLNAFESPAFNRAVGPSSSGLLANASSSPIGSFLANAGNATATTMPSILAGGGSQPGGLQQLLRMLQGG